MGPGLLDSGNAEAGALASTRRPRSIQEHYRHYRSLSRGGRAGAATAIGVAQSDRRPMTTAGGDLLFLSHGYLGAVVWRRA